MWQRERRRSGELQRTKHLIKLLHKSSAASPKSGLLSNWLKLFEPRSNWLHVACLTSGVISKLWRPPREMKTSSKNR